jgi:uncharacterized membrane protein
MSERGLRQLAVLLALAGAAVAAYLSYSRLADTALICPTTGCATVQRSAYATIAGVPVAYLGVVAYLAIAAGALSRRAAARPATALLAFAAAAFATYLLVAQLASIHAVCVWCLASDGIVYALLVVAVTRCRFVDRRARR